MNRFIRGILGLISIVFSYAYSDNNMHTDPYFSPESTSESEITFSYEELIFPNPNLEIGQIVEPFMPGKAEPPDFKTSYPIPQRISLRSIQRRGIGYPVGYTTLDGLFAPTYQRGHFLPMVDLRGHYLANNSYAANVGFIERYIPYHSCVIYGMNAYYDFRQGCRGNYHQGGIGFEILGTRWDFRVNGYFPIGQRVHHKRCEFDYPGGFVAVFKRKEFSFRGFNAEIGCYIVKSGNFLLYLAAGPYYLKGSDQESWGGKARLRPQYRDFLALDLSVSHDHLFKTNYQGEIIFSLPLYALYSKKNKKTHTCLSERQIYQPVQRFEIIPLKKHSGWHNNF